MSAYDALSFQRQKFIDLYVQLGNATAAAVGAGYSERSATQQGSMLLKEPDVRAALRERLDQLQLDSATVRARLAEIASADADDFISFRTVYVREQVLRPLAEVIDEARREIEAEELYAERVSLDPNQLADQEKNIEYLRRRIIRMEIELEQNPEAVRLVEGPLVAHEESYIDLAKMKRAGKLHLVKKVKRDKDGSMTVELHDRQSTLHHLDKMHELAQQREAEKSRGSGSEQLAGALGKMGITLNQVNVTNIQL